MAFALATALMTSSLRRRRERIKEHIKQKKSLSGWVLPRQTTTFADEGSWSNIDSGVTPIEQRTWSTWTVLGFWFSDALNAQGWECAASIIAIGLTWSVWMTPILCPLFKPVNDIRIHKSIYISVNPCSQLVLGGKLSTVSSSATPWSLFLLCSMEPSVPTSTSILPWPHVLLSDSTSHEQRLSFV